LREDARGFRRIALTQRIDYLTDRRELRDSLDERLVSWALKIGVLPVPVPNKLGSDLPFWLAEMRIEGFILSGGGDIGEHPCRDETENSILRMAEVQSLPVLGICRGMQILGNYSGGVLELLADHVGTNHRIVKDCAEIILPDVVNSYHHWGFRHIPGNFVPLARTEDGSIEAMRHQHLPWEGWMWHPEREVVFDLNCVMRARALFKIG
jgi:gamma-glutamyl-gamma-aminobutyrate hydrolase PuuD